MTLEYTVEMPDLASPSSMYMISLHRNTSFNFNFKKVFDLEKGNKFQSSRNKIIYEIQRCSINCL